jgi:hypothetical protein
MTAVVLNWSKKFAKSKKNTIDRELRRKTRKEGEKKAMTREVFIQTEDNRKTSAYFISSESAAENLNKLSLTVQTSNVKQGFDKTGNPASEHGTHI